MKLSRRSFIASVAAAGLPTKVSAALPRPVAFVNVNVVPMDGPHVLRGQTVLIRDGVVAALGRGIVPPAEAQSIDGHGRLWVSPGLADMHNHCDTRHDMAVMLAKGITTTLNMGEARNSYVGRLRLAIERGDTPGPRAFAALAVDGTSEYGHLILKTAEDVRAALRLASTNRYDFLKVYNNLAPEVFHTLAREAPIAGLPLVGHGVAKVGLARQLAAGQRMVAHAEEFFYTYFPQPPENDPLAAPEPSAIDGAVELIVRHGAFVVADLLTYARIAEQWGQPEAVQRFLESPSAGYVAPSVRAAWPLANYAKRHGSLSRRLEFLHAFVRAMSAAGVPLLSGTDAPDIPGLAPGFALHDHLRYLTRAGLTPFDALATATRNAGGFIAATKPGGVPFGTISTGARADLLLTASNPLEDLRTLETPLGVLAGGRWYDAASLAQLLASVKGIYGQASAPARPLDSARAAGRSHLIGTVNARDVHIDPCLGDPSATRALISMRSPARG
ncbi:amidohydrolase family protein [Chelativorans sp.]|uniref:amidohydrolase family protein n=1 Tax=Chelativorans sp. TaxID=2203393 RepID=UPI002810B60F|nr:amidohydrolase family protein [Chelativorans sp.]